jgi:hypothetical protein
VENRKLFMNKIKPIIPLQRKNAMEETEQV